MGWYRSAWLVGLTAVALHVIGLFAYVHRLRADWTILMAVSETRIETQSSSYGSITSSLGIHGYDGQFYYVIAHSPLGHFGAEVDAPGARQLRILFPSVSYLASFGQHEWLPWVMPLVNACMVGILAFIGAKWVIHHGINPWYGLTLTFVVDAALPMLRNLTDTTAMAMAAWLLYAVLKKQHYILIGLAGLAAILAREQNIAILGLVFGYSILHRRWGSAVSLIISGLLWLAWVAWLTNEYGSRPFLPTQGNFAPPFEGFGVAWDQTMFDWKQMSDRTKKRIYSMLVWYSLLILGSLGFCWKKGWEHLPKCKLTLLVIYLVWLKVSSVPSHLFPLVTLFYLLCMAIIWCVFAIRMKKEELLPLGMATGGMMLCLVAGPAIYEDYWSYGRAFFWLPMGLWFLIVQAGWKTMLGICIAVVYLPFCMVLYR